MPYPTERAENGKRPQSIPSDMHMILPYKRCYQGAIRKPDVVNGEKISRSMRQKKKQERDRSLTSLADY